MSDNNDININELESQKKLEESNRELRKLLEEEKKYTAIICSLSNVFYKLYLIDIDKNTIQELISFGKEEYSYGEIKPADIELIKIVETQVMEEYCAEMRVFMDVLTIDRRLGDKSIISQEYVTSGGFWARCSFIAMDRDEYGYNTKVICAFRNITSEKKKAASQENLLKALVIAYKDIDEDKRREISQNKKIEEALAAVEKANKTLTAEMEIVSALSREYQDVMLIDFVKDTSATIKRNGRIIPENERVVRHSYNASWDYYIAKYVIDEDKDMLYSAVSFDVVQRQLENNDEYICTYRVSYDETGIHHYQVAFIRLYIKDERKIILAFRNIDAIVEEEHRHVKIQEEQREIIDGLASDYYSILLVNPDTDKVTTYRANEEDGESIARFFEKYDYCWSKGVKSYANELVSDNSRSEFLEKLSPDYIKANSEEFSFTYEKCINGGIIYLQAKVAFVQERDGTYVAVVGTRNIDDLIKKERQQEMALKQAYDVAEAANKSKTDFLSNMSHDIRTPMNGIIGMTAIAAANIDDKERVKDSLHKISQASKHLLSLINEVLDMSKIESGKVDLAEEEFNLSDLVDNLLSMMNYQIKEHGHELIVNITDVVHEDVVGDSLRIQKVFTNILGNAVKFTPDGGKLSISIKERPSNQLKVGCYEFIFEDNGIGMSKEFISKIFDPFARASDGRVNKIQGTGLGMSISRNIVRMMGGDIMVESEPGAGSKFIVTMYLKLQDNDEVNYDKFVDLNVLVVDDDLYSLESCCDILNDFGMKAEGVTSGNVAVEYVKKHHEQNDDYFACIIDWKMPGIDGIETTRAIRKAVGNDVPIIIISAYDWTDIEQKARSAGVNAFISKPLFRSRLAKTFNSLMEEDEEKAEYEYDVSLDNIDLTGRRALLVEDNELNAEIASELLSMTGMDIEHAVDGVDAVDMILECEDGYYDIIFMDIQMPQMNGYDTTRAIRTMNRNYCRQVPIIAMSANAFAEDVQAAKTVGMNEHIAKPLELKAIVRTLNKWLR